MRPALSHLLLPLALAGHTLAAQTTPSLAHARGQFDARNYDAAKQEFTALARATPNDAVPVYWLGRVALQQNELDEGVKHLERCIKIDDTNADCHAWIGNALGSTAQKASKLKLPFLAKRIKKEFDRAVELDPANLEGRSGLVQYYMQAPGFLGGSMPRAREHAAEIEKFNKLRGALAYGLLADHEKNPKGAETAYQRAITVAPDSAIGYYGLLNSYLREKRWSDAFEVLDRLQARIPSDMSALLGVARVAYLSGEQLTRGEESAKRWLANPPRNASTNSQTTAHVRLGNIYEKTNRKELARAEYEAALALSPKNEDVKKMLDGVR